MQRICPNVPVDHDAPAAVADVPLGHKVLIPRTEFLGIGGQAVVPSPKPGSA